MTKTPTGIIAASGITVSLAPATPGAGPSASVTALGFSRLVGTSSTIAFVIPSALTVTAPTPYLISVTGSVAGGGAFSSTNTAAITIDPPAQFALTPLSGVQGQTLNVAINGTYTNFVQGATLANFGPEISVGGATANTAGPVTVTGPTSATAQLVIATDAVPGVNPVQVTTGPEQPTGSFTVAMAAAQPIDLAIAKSHSGNFTQGQSGTYTIAVSNLGPGSTSGTVTVTDTLPTGLSLVSMSGSGWACSGTTCTRSDSLGSGSAYSFITLVANVAASAPTSLINSVSVAGGGTDSSLGNNSASDLTTIVQVPASITATTGTPQSAPVNTAFGTALQATVRDAGGNPVSGVTVTFSAPASGASGTFTSATAVTNASGVATASAFTANGTAGNYTVTASASGVAALASFSLINTAGTPASITASAGTPQSAVINTAFGSTLQATVRDAANNPLSGVTVTFTVPGSGASASFASGNTAVTNASGIATSSVLTANSTVGSYTVTASVSGVSTPASFALTNTVGTAASITATAGTPQSTGINTAFGTALQATVRDAGNNPVSSVTVTFTAPGSGASGSFVSTTAVTNASGVATASTFTANGTAGSYTVTANVGGVSTPASFSLTNTVGTPASIAATGGTPQSTVISTAFGSALQVTVRDAGNNPLSGVTVTFTVPGSGATASFATGNTAVTNASGVANSSALTANATVGSYTVTASISGVSTPASFALTNTVGTVASIAATAGTPQSATVNTAFGIALQATVRDAGSNPVSGVTVTFSAPGSGASGSFVNSTAVTNANGVATASTFTANGAAGSYTVTATVSGVTSPANFSLTNTVGVPASITATGGTPQSAVISTAFGSALQATVRDAASNPLSGVTVTFSVPASGASAAFASGNTAVTNANGIATSSIPTANGTVGSYNVTAGVSGVSTPASFALTNTVGSASNITATAGTPQSAVINTAFGTALQATVRDAGNNPVSGVTVTFSVPASGATAAFTATATAVTNASGVATSSTLTANSIAGAYNVTATVSGVSGSATYALTNTPGAAASISATGGTPQSTIISTAFGSTLQAAVRDSGNNPVSGVTVTFAVPASGASASLTGGDTAVTNANGIATSGALTANSIAGTYNVTAAVSGVSGTASYALTNTPGSVASVTTNGGTPQSAIINTAFSSPLQAIVRDSGNNPISGVTVTFTAPASGASGTFPGSLTSITATTGSNGIATSPAFTAGSTAGSYNVTASVSGVSGTASFALTNTPGTAASITATSGSSQSTIINTAFGSNLQVRVLDSGNNPVSGATVTFAVPASGGSGTFAGNVTTATTNTNGYATAPVLTANATAGSFTVTASVSGVTGMASFFLTNTPGVPSTITATGGGTQSTIISTAFPSALQVLVRDSGGNAVSGVTVTFAVPASGASATFTGNVTTAVTNSSGYATSPLLTANATAGAFMATASVSGIATPASFSLTNTPGTPANVSVYSGTGQNTPVNTGFSGSLQVRVTDSGNNAVSGVTVTFAAPASGASGSFAGGVVTATTNSSGIATAPIFTANATPGSYQVTASVSGTSSQAVFTLTNTQANITTLNPASGTLGQTLNVAVTGTQSHFVQGTTTAYFGTGVTVNSVTVTSATAATVNITINPTTTLGYRYVTLTTGTEVATYTNGFYVGQGSATISSLNPATGAQGTQVNVAVVGTSTNFQQGVTTAYFGYNIGINSVTVTDATHATVNITIAGNATLGQQSVSLTTGGEVASYGPGFTITAGTAIITSVNPTSGNQGDAADTITITGQSTHFAQGTTTASFGSGITVTSLTVNSATSATAVISIANSAAIGNRMVTLTTGSEIANSSASAFSVAAGIPSATANPNFAVQGTNATIVINGNFTSFVQGVTTVSFNDGTITVGAVTVNGPGQLSVPIQIGTSTGVGSKTITVNTNGNLVTAPFTVAAGMPVITLISPNAGVPNSNVTVTIQGNFTNFVSGSTQVSFGAGISVGGGTVGQPGPVTVNNSGSLTANISIASSAATGPRTVTVTTGSQAALTVNSGFTVQTCTTTAPTVILNSPVTNSANVPLNTNIQIEFSAPINRTTVNTTDFYLYDTTTNQHIPATVSVDASGRILTLTPSVLLAVGRQYYAYYGNLGSGNQITDTCGNLIGSSYFYFTTTFSSETTGPSLIAASPQQGDVTGENYQVVLQFSAPINPITAAAGFVVSSNGTPVAGTYTPNANYAQYTFVPSTNVANSTITVTYSSALQDGSGNTLTNPGSFTFTTNSTVVANGTTTTLYTDPYNNQTNVSTSIQPTAYYSGILDPITATSSVFYLNDAATGRRIPATVAVAADRRSVILTPLQPLQPTTQYYFYTGNVYDLQGAYVYSVGTYFTTGGGSTTTAATVATVSPFYGQNGTPINTHVVIALNAPYDPGSINNSSITVKQGNTLVPGTVAQTSSTVLTFTPTANLTPSTSYTVTTGGFLDGNELAVPTFTSVFTTGSSTTAQTSNLTVLSVSPANGATNLANIAPITLTFSAPVDPTSIGGILVRDASNGYYPVAGTWAVNSDYPTQVTFAPTAPYPANSQIQVYTNGDVRDLAGNADNYFSSYFTTSNVADTSAFKVVGISPANGATGVGRNPAIVITFNKSVNQNSLGITNAIQFFASDQNISVGGRTISADGRTVTFTPTLPASSNLNVEVTPLVTDLSGNPVAAFTSSFQTAADITATAPTITQMLPANGSSDVLTTMPITLYTNGAALNPATVTNTSLYVSQNGILVQGTIQVSSGGQSITFTPSGPFTYGALVQVFVQPTITDIYGNAINSYSGQFTIQGNPQSVAPVLLTTSPLANAINAPVNVLPQMKFDQPLLASTISSASVEVISTCNNQQIPGTPSLIGGGYVIQFKPANNLPATCNSSPAQFYMQVNYGSSKITNVDGVAISGSPYFYFTVSGSTADTTAPTVVAVAPTPGSSNVGINATITVQFSEPIDPISVNGTTVSVTGGSQTAIPATITFDSTGTYAMLQPELPLPTNTTVTITVNGVTDFAGNTVTSYSSTFTTQAGAVTTGPQVLYESVASNATGVPTNAILSVQFNEPIAAVSLTSASYYLYDTVTGSKIPATLSISADRTTITLTPLAPLSVNRQYYYYVTGVRDDTGVVGQTTYWYFTTESVTSALLPLVTAVNPTNNLSNVPTNAVVQLLFNEPIAPDTVSNVTINLNGTPIAATASFSRSNTLVSLTPSQLLLPNTTYTITATGVVDFAGHAQTSNFSSTFTTASTSDISNGSVAASYIPEANATNVALNIHPTFYFTKQVNPLSIYPGIFTLRNYATGGNVNGTTTVSSDQMSVTFTPAQNLQPDTQYYLSLSTVYDVAGNYLSGTGISFTTGTAATTTGASVASISPPNNQTGVPLNTQVVAIFNAPVSQNTFGASPVTVTAGSTAVAGTTTLGSDEMTLTFTPAANLVASTVYTITVGGFSDQNGNPVQTASSTFTTGNSLASSTLSVVSVTPANNTTISNNSTPIVLTFNQTVDPASVTNILIRDQSDNYYPIAGSWSASGAVATFTPSTPYPANHLVNVYVTGVLGYSGSTCNGCFGSYFTAANMADTTAPTVTSVTPVNNATTIGINPPIVLTFSKSLNQGTATTTSIAVFAGDTKASYSLSFSPDGRTVMVRLNSALPANTLVTVSASSAIQDLSGNALVPFQSVFTTGSSPATQSNAPTVTSQIPANGATDISTGTAITLYTNGTALDPTTVNSNTFQVSANGQLVSGTTQVVGAHAIEFTPTTALPYGALVQVFLSTGVMDVNGFPLQSAYSGQFTVQGNPASTAAVAKNYSPLANSTNVALNVKPQIMFDQAIQQSSLNATNAFVYCNSSQIAGSASIIGNGTIVQFTPTSNLPASTSCYFQINGNQGAKNTSGVAISGSPYFYFTTGTATDTTVPTVTAIGPPAGSNNVGINSVVIVRFSKPIDPLSVTGSTIAITGSGQTVVPASISFDSTAMTVTVQPTSALPPSTTITVTVNGVTDPEGNVVTSTSSTFTTMASVDTTAPTLVAGSFVNGGTIPLNTTAFSLTFSKPLDPATVTPTTFRLYDGTQGVTIPATSITASSDLMTYTLTVAPQASPATGVQFNVGDLLYLQVLSPLDLTGNSISNAYYTGTVVSTIDTTAPTVVEVNPIANLTNVPTNTLPQIEFSKPVSSTSALTNIQLLQGSTPVPATITLSSGNAVVAITPNSPLAEGTTYTISASGVKDIQGTPMTSPYTSSFTTSSTGISLTYPTVVSVSPANGTTGVSVNVAPVIVFSKAMNPLNFDQSLGYAVLKNNANSVVVPATVSLSSDGKTLTLTPTAPLSSATTYQIYISYYYLTDVAGNRLQNTSQTIFTTQ